ncbi:MAG: hypothetical protein BWX71_00596 [Deltaproteobacteria bacterium ADurb.Bin072]|nr:MAG: hypothetical protein BWX71_00596 [Deltaproteobacteria bacterium ADurb.Bin072]
MVCHPLIGNLVAMMVYHVREVLVRERGIRVRRRVRRHGTHLSGQDRRRPHLCGYVKSEVPELGENHLPLPVDAPHLLDLFVDVELGLDSEIDPRDLVGLRSCVNGKTRGSSRIDDQAVEFGDVLIARGAIVETDDRLRPLVFPGLKDRAPRIQVMLKHELAPGYLSYANARLPELVYHVINR